MNELSVVGSPNASRSPEPSTPLPTKSADRAIRPLKWKMCDGSRRGPAWLWLPFLSSHGIGYGSSLPPTGGGIVASRVLASNPPVAQAVIRDEAPTAAVPSPITRRKLLRPASPLSFRRPMSSTLIGVDITERPSPTPQWDSWQHTFIT